ncbi:MAG: Na/Pi cotransporter family protein [Planctomycetota bacterium]|jgi:phosphate:Na+ symporter
MNDPSTLDVAAISVGLLGGLCLFLFGMEQMTDSLKAVAGSGMKTILAKLTTNRFMAAFTGAFVTAVIQSSSVTTVLVVGFISAGLMSLSQSFGIIMGANVGTTITAQIIAFKVTKYAMVLIIIGFAMLFIGKRRTVKHVGGMVMGLGLIFFGMGLMSDATNPLRTYDPFIEMMRNMDKPILGMLVGAAFTALVQSSSATTGIVIVLASQGFITLEAGIALALGANIGTCVTAVLASLGKPRAALQAAAAHILFNVLGALLWVAFIGYLADFVRWFSPASPELAGTERLAAEAPRQIANAHTFFNVANTLLFLGFTGPLAKLVERLVPTPPAPSDAAARPRYLHEVLLETPPIAVDWLRREIVRLGSATVDVLTSISPARQHSEEEHQRTEQAARDAVSLHGHIVKYSRSLLAQDLSDSDSERVENLLAISNQINAVTDTLVVGLQALGERWRKAGLQASEETRQQFGELHDEVVLSMQNAVAAVRDWDEASAIAVTKAKSQVRDRGKALKKRLAERLSSDTPDRIEVYQVESQAAELILRVEWYARRIAKRVTRRAEAFEALPDKTSEMPAYRGD